MIEHLIGDGGAATPIAFIVVYVALTVALVPGSVPSVAAGVLFGAVWGSVLTVLGATLGATAAFLLARRFGRAPVRARGGDRFERLDGWVAQHGFATVLYVRLVPLFPFNAVNYAFGLTAVRARDYVAATALGIVPGTVAFVALGSSLGQPGSPGFLVALGMVLTLVVGAPLIDRTLKRNASAAAEPPSR